MTQQTTDTSERRGELRDTVRRRYAAAARDAMGGSATCCGDDVALPVDGSPAIPTAGDGFGLPQYGELDDDLPEGARAASLGCGNPMAVAELGEGEVVLDLGSGGGIDVLLSARRVGPTGRAIGLDMTDEMLELARRNAADAGVDNVTFIRGEIERVPLDDASVDVVISNCVINLSTDKPAVFAEMFRVLRPGGRVGVTDVVAEDRLTAEQRAERGSYVGCIAGALSYAEYRRALVDAGFVDVTITPTHAVADGMDSAIVRAARPG